jgi:nitrate/nitrite-specific signal transduction histidine kinase
MTVTPMQRRGIADRLVALESRADGHDRLHAEKISPMVDQVDELYKLLTKWRNINWFLVKVVGWGAGALGFIAVVVTIAAGVTRLVTGH